MRSYLVCSLGHCVRLVTAGCGDDRKRSRCRGRRQRHQERRKRVSRSPGHGDRRQRRHERHGRHGRHAAAPAASGGTGGTGGTAGQRRHRRHRRRRRRRPRRRRQRRRHADLLRRHQEQRRDRHRLRRPLRKVPARQSVSRQRRLHLRVQGGQDLRRLQRRRRLSGQRVRMRAPHLHRRRLRQHARGRGHRARRCRPRATASAASARPTAPSRRQRRHRRARGPQPVHQRPLHDGRAVAHDDARELQLRRRQPLQRQRPVRRVRGRRGLPGDRHRLPHANLLRGRRLRIQLHASRTPSSSTRPRKTARACSAMAPATRRSSTTTLDLPFDDNVCTTDECSSGTASHRPVPSGMGCGGSLVCDGANNCVECLSASTCPGSDTDCHTRSCVTGQCGITNLAAGTLAAAQSPRDCKKNVCNGQGDVRPGQRRPGPAGRRQPVHA